MALKKSVHARKSQRSWRVIDVSPLRDYKNGLEDGKYPLDFRVIVTFGFVQSAPYLEIKPSLDVSNPLKRSINRMPLTDMLDCNNFKTASAPDRSASASRLDAYHDP